MGIFRNLQRTGSDWVLLRSENFKVLITFSYLQDYHYYYYYYYFFCKSESASRAFERTKTFFLSFAFVLFCWQILSGHGGIHAVALKET